MRIVVEVLVATIPVGLIGIERRTRDKPAGLRTLMLVAAASGVFMNVGRIYVCRA